MTEIFGEIDLALAVRPESLVNPMHQAFISIFTGKPDKIAK